MKGSPLDPFGRSIWALLLIAVTAACAGGGAGAGATTAATIETTTTAASSTTADESSSLYTDKNDNPVTTNADTTTTSEVTTTTALTATTSTTGTATTSTPAAGQTVTVAVDSFSFSPSTINIKVGDTVQWLLAGGSHTTTSGTPPTPDGNWNKVVTAEAPVEVTFDQAGQFPYYCRFHPDFMSGVVVVEP